MVTHTLGLVHIQPTHGKKIRRGFELRNIFFVGGLRGACCAGVEKRGEEKGGFVSFEAQKNSCCFETRLRRRRRGGGTGGRSLRFLAGLRPRFPPLFLRSTRLHEKKKKVASRSEFV